MNESQKKGNKKSKQNTEYWDKITCKERFFPRISVTYELEIKKRRNSQEKCYEYVPLLPFLANILECAELQSSPFCEGHQWVPETDYSTLVGSRIVRVQFSKEFSIVPTLSIEKKKN